MKCHKIKDEQAGTSKTRHETDDDKEVQRKKKVNYECAFQDECMKRSEYKWLKEWTKLQQCVLRVI
jgi:hypothetical protein